MNAVAGHLPVVRPPFPPLTAVGDAAAHRAPPGSFLLWLVLASLAGPSPSGPSLASGQSLDTVVRRSGSPLRGEILSSSKDGITLSAEGGQQIVSANDIRYVVYGGEPTSMRQIRDAANKGNTERAQRYLDGLSRDKVEGDLVRADLRFYEALVASQKAIASGVGLAEAGRTMRSFVNDYRESFHFYRAAEVLGDLAVAMQRPDDAARFYGVLEKSPWEDVRLRGTVKMADALRAAGGQQNLSEALSRYDKLIGAVVHGDEAQRQKKLAQIGKAACQAQLGSAAEAIPVLEQLVASAPTEDAELLVSGYNALGLSYQAAGRLKDAVLAYLRVELLFPNQQSARAEAFYRLSLLWDELGQTDRATEARQSLQHDFPESAWARKIVSAPGAGERDPPP